MTGKVLIACGGMLVGACNANTAYPPPADNGNEGGEGSGDNASGSTATSSDGGAGAAGANADSATGGAASSTGRGATTVGGGTGGSGGTSGGTGGSGGTSGGTGGGGGTSGGGTGGSSGSGGSASACTVDDECDSGHCLIESGVCVECDVTVNDCDAGSFCAISGECADVEFSRLCESRRITAGQSGIDPDDEALSLAAVALIDTCGDGVEGRAVAQSDPSVADAATGEPLIPGGEVLLVVGGPNANPVGGYVEREGISPLYFEIAEGQYRYVLRSTGEVAYGTNLLDDAHDLLLFQVMRVPSGGLVVYGYGGRGTGTAAAGWFLANVMIPSVSELDQAWYIYQWTDLAALGPDSSDDFVLRASGS